MRLPGVRIGDVIVLVICVCILVFGAFRLYAGRSGELSVQIQCGDGEWMYPLSAEIDLDIGGPLGTTSVHIHDGAAWISDSPCRDKVCVKMGRADSLHGWIACLPNKVFIRITAGGGSGDVDGIVF